MSYFTHFSNDDKIGYLYASNLERGTSFMQFNTRVSVGMRDTKGNMLLFKLTDVAVSEQIYVCELVRSIAMNANGSIRKLVEDDRVLLLMKKFGLEEIFHTAPLKENSAGTLWTQEDAYALE